jgi:hypothetical protein
MIYRNSYLDEEEEHIINLDIVGASEVALVPRDRLPLFRLWLPTGPSSTNFALSDTNHCFCHRGQRFVSVFGQIWAYSKPAAD